MLCAFEPCPRGKESVVEFRKLRLMAGIAEPPEG
jgi:hypothetical protein